MCTTKWGRSGPPPNGTSGEEYCLRIGQNCEVENCPTTGGGLITITGFGWDANISDAGRTDVKATILTGKRGGSDCLSLYFLPSDGPSTCDRPSHRLVCELPPFFSSQSLAIVLRAGDTESDGYYGINYASPTIHALSASKCKTVESDPLSVTDCAVTGGFELTVQGANFGDDPFVWIGAHQSANVTVPWNETQQRVVVCSVPAGTRPVTVLVQQRNGRFSQNAGGLSYQSCPPGTFLNETGGPRCVNCTAGTFNVQSGQYVCVPCGTLDFTEKEGQTKCDVCTHYDSEAIGTEDGRFCECGPNFLALSFDQAKVSPLRHTLSPNRLSEDQNKLGFYCVPCPQGANCSRAGTHLANIQALPGYFKGTDSSNSTFFSCFIPNACSGAAKCVDGYTGPACAQCDVGYVSDGAFGCNECLPSSQLIPISIAALIFLFLACGFYIRHLVTSSHLLTDTLVKVAISGIQVNIFALNYQFNWESYLDTFLKIEHDIATIGIGYLQLDCYIQPPSGMSVFFLTQLFFFVSPLVLVVVMPAVLIGCVHIGTVCCRQHPIRVAARHWWTAARHWWTVSVVTIAFLLLQILCFCLGCSALAARHWWTVSVVIIAFLLFPTLAQRFLLFFSCQRLGQGDELYLTGDLGVKCWSKQHVFYTLVLGVPYLVLYVLGIPLGGYLILRYGYRHQLLDDAPFFRKYGFLYHGYRLTYDGSTPIFAWDVVLQLRKFSVMALGIFFSDSVEVASMLALFVLGLFLLLQTNRRPFSHDLLNLAEVVSLTVSLLTFYSGLFSVFDLTISVPARPYLSAFSLGLNILFLLVMARIWCVLRWRENDAREVAKQAKDNEEEEEEEEEEQRLEGLTMLPSMQAPPDDGDKMEMAGRFKKEDAENSPSSRDGSRESSPLPVRQNSVMMHRTSDRHLYRAASFLTPSDGVPLSRVRQDPTNKSPSSTNDSRDLTRIGPPGPPPSPPAYPIVPFLVRGVATNPPHNPRSRDSHPTDSYQNQNHVEVVAPSLSQSSHAHDNQNRSMDNSHSSSSSSSSSSFSQHNNSHLAVPALDNSRKIVQNHVNASMPGLDSSRLQGNFAEFSTISPNSSPFPYNPNSPNNNLNNCSPLPNNHHVNLNSPSILTPSPYLANSSQLLQSPSALLPPPSRGISPNHSPVQLMRQQPEEQDQQDQPGQPQQHDQQQEQQEPQLPRPFSRQWGSLPPPPPLPRPSSASQQLSRRRQPPPPDYARPPPLPLPPPPAPDNTRNGGLPLPLSSAPDSTRNGGFVLSQANASSPSSSSPSSSSSNAATPPPQFRLATPTLLSPPGPPPTPPDSPEEPNHRLTTLEDNPYGPPPSNAKPPPPSRRVPMALVLPPPVPKHLYSDSSISPDDAI
eukprot:g20679.t1